MWECKEVVNSQKGEHLDKDVLGGSGLRGVTVENTSTMNVLNSLFVPIQNDNHWAAQPSDEGRK